MQLDPVVAWRPDLDEHGGWRPPRPQFPEPIGGGNGPPSIVPAVSEAAAQTAQSHDVTMPLKVRFSVRS